jgi:DNA-binding transcriptional MerR regulator
VEDILEISPAITSFDWKEFTDRDKIILDFLLTKQREGASISEIAQLLAEALKLAKPDTSGKVIVNRRLKHIEKVSTRLKGFSIVVSDKRKWYLNYDDFQFVVKIAETSRTKEHAL